MVGRVVGMGAADMTRRFEEGLREEQMERYSRMRKPW